jgi:hypothetical protein
VQVHKEDKVYRMEPIPNNVRCNTSIWPSVGSLCDGILLARSRGGLLAGGVWYSSCLEPWLPFRDYVGSTLSEGKRASALRRSVLSVLCVAIEDHGEHTASVGLS